MKSQMATTALFFLMVSPALGQQERPTMTLEEVVQVARQRNPAFRRAEIGTRSAEANVLAAYGSFKAFFVDFPPPFEATAQPSVRVRQVKAIVDWFAEQ